jgi:hypothetical protein
MRSRWRVGQSICDLITGCVASIKLFHAPITRVSSSVLAPSALFAKAAFDLTLNSAAIHLSVYVWVVLSCEVSFLRNWANRLASAFRFKHQFPIMTPISPLQRYRQIFNTLYLNTRISINCVRKIVFYFQWLLYKYCGMKYEMYCSM